MLARWCNTGSLNVRGIVANKPLRTTVRAPALMSHELCNFLYRPDILTRSCLEHHRGCWQHVPREKETRKYQSTAVDDEEDDEDGDEDGDDDDGQATSMACRAREDGEWTCPARPSSRPTST